MKGRNTTKDFVRLWKIGIVWFMFEGAQIMSERFCDCWK